MFVMQEGHATLWQGDNTSLISASRGDVVVFLGEGDPQAADTRASPIRPLAEVLTRSHVLNSRPIQIGNGRPVAQFVAVMLRFGIDAPRRLTKHLPRSVCTRAETHPDIRSGLLKQFEFAVQECQKSIADAIAPIVLMDILRQHLGESDGAGLTEAVSDPHIGPLLALIYQDPAKPWTTAMMQDEAGLSKTPFFERFRTAVGCSPTMFLREVRVQHAMHLLATTDLTISEIARSTGYRSSGSLCSVFKAITGVTPNTFREGNQFKGVAPPLP